MSLLTNLLCCFICQGTFLEAHLTHDGGVHWTNPAFPGGGEDTLKDDSLMHHEDLDGDGAVSKGDRGFWICKISDLEASGQGNVHVEDHLVVFVAFQVSDGHLEPDLAVLPGWEPAFGLILSSTVPPKQSALQADYHDLGQIFTPDTHQIEITLDLRESEIVLFGPGQYSVRFTADIRAEFRGVWLPVDIPFSTGNRYGQCVCYGYIWGQATDEEQSRGWNRLVQADFIVNSLRPRRSN